MNLSNNYFMLWKILYVFRLYIYIYFINILYYIFYIYVYLNIHIFWKIHGMKKFEYFCEQQCISIA